MTKYRKKRTNVEIEAMQLIGTAGDTAQVLDWMAANLYPMLVGDYTSPETLRYHDQVPEDDSRRPVLVALIAPCREFATQNAGLITNLAAPRPAAG